MKRGTPTPTEAGFTRVVVDLFRLRGWLVYHPLPLRTKAGEWRTGTQGDRGWPDVAAAKATGGVGRLVLAELKVGKGRTTPDQDAWLSILRLVPGVEVYLWTPASWDEIVAVAGA